MVHGEFGGLLLGGLLLLLNVGAVLVMGWDKFQAQRQGRRVPERTLFLLALGGGSVGCLAGMYGFRHKTRHASFVWGMPLILLAQLSLALALFWR
ncbi:MAG TPA: DUF1294 domain-containing protein [Synergistaceae bacterium]|nr:DUF1294 domain-containing protein [Synergistaceae bacterium]HQF92062.1 DUF1294 domain-containing protein [Synergistaceae bacterium]